MATPASPLPLPAPLPSQVADSDLMLQAAANATGASRPDITAGAALTATTVGQAGTNAQAASQFADAHAAATGLAKLSPQKQQGAWQQFDASQQAQLRAAGYRPPGGRSVWGDIGHFFSHDVGHDVGGGILHALGAPLRVVQHAARAGIVNFEGAGGSNRHIFNLSDWARAWDETASGEKYIDPGVERQVQQQYGNDIYQLAHRLATGTSPQQLVAGYPKAQQQQILAELSSNAKLQDAVNQLNYGHLSVGRGLVPASFHAAHPAIASDLSGGIDALFDFFGDPVVIGTKAMDGARAARFVVHDSSDVENLYDRSPSVRRAMGDIAGHVAAGDVDGLLTRYPKLGAAAQQLFDANAVTQEQVRDYFASQAGVSAMLQGDPIRAGELNGAALPHLSWAAQAKPAVKQALQKTIDWAADRQASIDGIQPDDLVEGPIRPTSVGNRLVVGAGRFARHALNVQPTTRLFNPNDPHALESLRSIALQFLPRANVDNLLREFATQPDLGAKWKIYRSLMLQMGKAAGLESDPDFWDSYVGRFASTEGRVYAPGGKDLMSVDGTRIHAGVLKGDMNSGWLIPSFKDLYTQAKKVGLTQAATRAVNIDAMDKYMSWWRPLTLLRYGFATRVGGEEAANFILREGMVAYLRAQAANLALRAGTRAAHAAAADAAGAPLDETPLTTSLDQVADQTGAHVWNRLSGPLMPAVKDRITNMRDLMSQYVADQTVRAMRLAGGLTGAQYADAVQHLIDHGAMDHGGPFDTYLTAMHGYDYDLGDAAAMGLTKVKDMLTGTLHNAELVGTGAYKGYARTDDLFKHMWHHLLSTIASDDWAREALLTGRTRGERVAAIADKLEADPMWRNSIRSTQTRAGRLVASGEATDRQAAEDHAQAIIDLVDSAVRSPKTRKVLQASDDQSLAHYMLVNGRPPSLTALDHIAQEDLPYEVRGPELVPGFGTENVLRVAGNRFFSKFIGPQINWISRQPMFVHNYTVSRDAYKGMAAMWRAEGIPEESIEQLVHDGAVQRAINLTIPYVHDPRLRSDLSLVTRNVAPFWFAQEQFYKRWARAFSHSPWSFRQAQLYHMGIKHAGFIHNDPQTGNNYFVYPGSALVQKVLTDAVTTLGVRNAALPVAFGLTGRLNALNPGIERLGGPSFGPLVVLPLNAIMAIDPHFTKAVTSVEGSVPAQSGFLKAMLPEDVNRALSAIDPSMFDPAQYASAQADAIQALEATGHGIGQVATTQVGSGGPPPQTGRFQAGDYWDDNGTIYVYQPDGQWQRNDVEAMQTYNDRVKNWTRIMFLTRFLYGMSGPASPETQFNPGGLHDDLQRLLKSSPSFDDATQTFLAQHPDATAYTVFQTTNKTGGTLPATAAAMQFLDNNPDLTGRYPMAATYFIPAADTSGKFDVNAYHEQLAEGLRQKRTPTQYYQEILYQTAARYYYQNDDIKNQAIAAHPNEYRQIDEAWTRWSESFMAANPVFANMYATNGPTSRAEIMTQVGDAIRSGVAPPGPQTAALAKVFDGWVAWQGAVGNYGNPNANRLSSAEAQSIDVQFARWLAQMEQAYPSVAPLVQRAIAPDLTSTLNTLAQQGNPVTL